MICNIIALAFLNHGPSSEPVETSIVSDVMTILVEPSTLILVFNNALCGIVTSLFLKSLNSILKTFAAAIELVFTAIICWLLFHIAIDKYTVISIGIVSYATYLYSKHPLVTPTYSLLTAEDDETERRSQKNSLTNV